MTDAAQMFQPLSPEEVAAPPNFGHEQRPKPVPIVPVPDNAPPMQYRHREHGEPTSTWAYHDAGGQVVGSVLRWDFTNSDGKPDKKIRPVCYCDLGDGRRAWRSVGMPCPRPLLRLPDILARPDARVLIVEGEKAADAASKLFPELVTTTPPHGAQSPHKADWMPLKGRQVVVWPDNDKSGSEYAEAVARLCTESGAVSVAIVPVPPDFKPEWDLAEPLPEGWTVERLRELLDAARAVEPKDSRRLRAVNIGDFLSMEIPPREMVLAPVLPSQGLVMLYALRGVGKTFAALGMGYAVATGGAFFRWQAPAPQRVLYVDGEMPARVIQVRLAQIVQGAEKEPPSTDFLRIITPDLQLDGIPDISSTEARRPSRRTWRVCRW